MKMEFDKAFKFEVTCIPAYDQENNKECLDVMTNLSRDISRYYYEKVDEEYIKRMPEDVLDHLLKQLTEECRRRYYEKTGYWK